MWTMQSVSDFMDRFLHWQEYRDRSFNTIKAEVKRRFDDIDSCLYRDDQEIWEAWMNTIDSYIKDLKYAKWLRVYNEDYKVDWNWGAVLVSSENIYKHKALTYFTKARNELVKKFNNVSGIKITSSNENRQLINEVARDIDDAENAALKLIEFKLNPMQQQKNVINRSSAEDESWEVKVNNWEIVRHKPMFTQDKNGVLTFTDRSNKPKINEAIWWLFKSNSWRNKGKEIIYQIDYSNCTNQNIKNKMMSLTWTWKCRISFDKQANTYLLRNSDWKPIPTRPLIREGVKLKRDEIIQWDAYEAEEKRKENIWKIEEKDVTDDRIKELAEDMPSSLEKKLKNYKNGAYYKKFFVENEKRLGEILRYGKKYGYELHTNPVAKLYIASWLMEVKFIRSDTEVDVTIRENDDNKLKDTLWRDLYDLLDGEESDYLTYLTSRVQKLRSWKFAELTRKDSLLEIEPNYNLQESEKLPIETAKKVNYWIDLLKEFIGNYRISEWNSRLDNDDNTLMSLQEELLNLEYTIESRRETTKKEDMEDVINKSIDRLASYWAAYWNMYPDPEKAKIRDALLWSTEEIQQDAISRMACWKRINWDVTERKLLKRTIAIAWEVVQTNEAVTNPTTWEAILDENWNPIMEKTMKWWLEIVDPNINEKFQKINKLLFTDLVYDNNEIVSSKQQRQIINKLYDASRDSNKIITILTEYDILPKERKDDEDVKEKAKEIANALQEKKKLIDSLTENDVILDEQKEKRELEMKPNKSEEDLQRLQVLEYLETHEDDAKRIHQISLSMMKDEIRYWWINDIFRNSLATIYAEKWWWAKWKNWELFNDMIWYGFWDVSDENAKMRWEIITEIIITVVVGICTMWTWAAIVAWAFRATSVVARSARLIKLANNISNAVRLLNAAKNVRTFAQWYRIFKVANTAGKLALWTTIWTSLLLEGTIFNSATNVIHSAMNGTSIFENLNLNPIAKENIQTAAFLWVLSISWKLTQSLMRVWWKSKLSINLMEWLEKWHLQDPARCTAEVVTELWWMLAAEQVINLTFWHDVIDPETWEVHREHSLVAPTQQELCQMIGMIIAFKMVKPTFWAKVESKLNNWTLEICRTENRKNPVVRNTETWLIVPLKDLPNNTEILKSQRRTGTEWERRTGTEWEGRTGTEWERRTGTEWERRTGTEWERRTAEDIYKDISKMEEELAKKESQLQGEENEAESLTRIINNMKRKWKLTEREQKKLKKWEENLAKRNEDIAKLKEEISGDKANIRWLEYGLKPKLINTLLSKEWLKIGKDIYKMEENQNIFILKKNWQEIARGNWAWSRELDSEVNKLVEEYKREQSSNQSISNEWETNSYFDGKRSKFNITEETARNNSQTMDKIVDRNNPNDLAYLRETISIQYKNATGEDCPNLTDQQLRTIIEAHKQLWELWNLTQWELLKKVRVLSKTITDVNFRRFLLESWFCWKWWKEGLDASFKKSLVDRDLLADTISKNRYEQWWYPKWKLEIRKWERLSVDRFFKKHPDMKAKYEDALKIQDPTARANELSKIDVELAEQFILEAWRYIEFWVWKAEKAEASFKALNELYNWKVEKIIREDWSIVLRLKQEPTQVKMKKKTTRKPETATETKKWNEGNEEVESTLKKSLVDRDQFADTISKNRYEQWWFPKWDIIIREWEYVNINRFFETHPNMKAKYEEALKIQDPTARANELSKIDVELAEQLILETWRAIEFWAWKAEKAEASYRALNEVYNWKVEKIIRKDWSVILKLKQEPVPTGWGIIPKQNTEVAPKENHEIVKREPSLLTTIENSNVPVIVWERLPATITLKWWEIVPTEKVMPPTVRTKLNNALAVIEKKGWLPAVIEKHPEIIPVLPSKWIMPPYWLVPLLLIPWLPRDEDEDHSIIMKLPDDFSNVIDQIEENPKITGVELPTDITWPFDPRWNSNAIKAEIDTKFDDLIKTNHIETPLRDNALILLRWVSSWTYKGNWDWEQYNKNLSLTRAEEFKRYLMQKFPELTEDNFVIDSHYQPDDIDEAQRFQWVSMGVVDMQKYWGISSIRQLIPSGQDWRVL